MTKDTIAEGESDGMLLHIQPNPLSEIAGEGKQGVARKPNGTLVLIQIFGIQLAGLLFGLWMLYASEPAFRR